MTAQAKMLIGGQWRAAQHARDIRSPAGQRLVGQVTVGGRVDAAAAAGAAAAALPGWADTPPRQRADLLHRAAGLISQRAGQIAELLAAEAGKRRPEAAGEVAFAVEYFRWFGEQARRPVGEVLAREAPGRRHLTIRRPAGVVASLTPWNFPCSIQARKLAPALAAGCTVVARVSEKAPLAATEMVRCLADAGFPPGVVNLVHGPAAEITDALLEHPAVRVVSFTGSTAVGQAIMAKASRRVVRPLLELGGDAAFIVFDDADLDGAVAGAMLAKFRNTGQSCIAANRFLVQDGVYDDFVARFAAAVDAMTVGDGLADPVPDLGPCIDAARVRTVTGMVDEALAAGAKKVTRDFTLPAGTFAAPALLTDVPGHVALARQEIFGPAAGIFRFHAESEALDRANATQLGLAGYFYTRDQARVWRVAEHLEAGIVGVNDPLPSVCFAPMGGVKQSGIGREGAAIGLEEFEDIRYLAVGL